jgi:8-oxo-dGTP pyrophosphatase MutT (NUDIX family)
MDRSVKVVSAILQLDEDVLLCLRANTKHAPRHWSLPIGHVESGENNIDALRRELYEEIGIQLIDCQLFTTLYDNELNIENNIYQVTQWRGEVENREPNLCAAIRWHSISRLPSPLTVATEAVLTIL